MMLNRERRLRLLQKSNESVKDVGLHILFALLESEKRKLQISNIIGKH
jgi:hypothetical protein